MSRTYRYYDSYYVKANGILYTSDEHRKIERDEIKAAGQSGYYRGIPSAGWKGIHIFEKQRDRKPWNKPPKWFKQQNRRIERAQVKQALCNEKDIPIFKNTDRYEWS